MKLLYSSLAAIFIFVSLFSTHVDKHFQNTTRIKIRETQTSLNDLIEHLQLIADIGYRMVSVLKGDYEGLTRLLDKIYIDPTIAIGLARLNLNIGEVENALTLLDSLTPLEADHFVHRAELYALAFEFDRAIADMDAAIEVDPANAEIYVQRGNIIMLLYEWDRALADYNRALELDPAFGEAYYRRGILYYSLLEREDALEDFEMYLTLSPYGAYITEADEYIEAINSELQALTAP